MAAIVTRGFLGLLTAGLRWFVFEFFVTLPTTRARIVPRFSQQGEGDLFFLLCFLLVNVFRVVCFSLFFTPLASREQVPSLFLLCSHFLWHFSSMLLLACPERLVRAPFFLFFFFPSLHLPSLCWSSPSNVRYGNFLSHVHCFFCCCSWRAQQRSFRQRLSIFFHFHFALVFPCFPPLLVGSFLPIVFFSAPSFARYYKKHVLLYFTI